MAGLGGGFFSQLKSVMARTTPASEAAKRVERLHEPGALEAAMARCKMAPRFRVWRVEAQVAAASSARTGNSSRILAREMVGTPQKADPDAATAHTALSVEAGTSRGADTRSSSAAHSPAQGYMSAAAETPPLRNVIPKWWKLVRLWFTGEERWKARGYAASCIGLALATTLFSVHISYAQRDFSTALSGKDVPGFYAAVRKFVIIIIVACPLFSFNSWVEERLVLAWRAYLTRRLAKQYFAGRAFYHIQQRGDAAAHAPAIGARIRSSSSSGGGGGHAHSSGAAAGGPAAGGGIDNPDQRICDDVAAFVRSSVSLSLTLCRKIFSCAAFAGVLWGVSGNLVLFMFVYAGVGTFVTTAMFGRIMTSLYYRTLAREADLRFSLVRVRENAESIAFYRGEGGERSRVLSRLAAVLAITADRIRWNALYDVWTSMYSYATILVPSLLTAPRYFKGEIEFGVISQASFAFSRIDDALSIIINNLAAISGLAAETERLDALGAAMASSLAIEGPDGAGGSPAAAAAAASLLLSSPGGADVIARRADPALRGLLLKGLTVITPHGTGDRTLAADVTFALQPGQSLLVVGASGCGKSSLLRAIAGLWHAGGGCVTLPGPERAAVFFLPQKPFMPLGDLRTQLTFPRATADEDDANAPPARTTGGTGSAAAAAAASAGQESLDGASERAPLLPSAASGAASASAAAAAAAEAPGSDGAGGAGGAKQLSDEQLLALLDDVCLPDLVARVGGLDVELDWSSVLSVGEQQRVAVLRLLAAAPRLAFLDEATSALDGPTEGRLYGLIRKRVGCYVSVGHRMQLLQHHTHCLEILGGGQWRFGSAADYQKRLAAGGSGLHH